VFALLGGAAPGSWRPVHDFCERNRVPCLFPTTDLPVIDERSFYSVYFSRGVTLEADSIARHLSDEGLLSLPVVQVYRAHDPRGVVAAAQLRRQIEERGGRVTDFIFSDESVLTGEFWRSVAQENAGGTAVLWLGGNESAGLWQAAAPDALGRIYLSSSLYGLEPAQIPPDQRGRVFVAHRYEHPGRLPRLLARSTGWLKAKRIYAPEAQWEQANAFFALKMTGGALKAIGAYFVPEYLLENVEHMVDNASYTSVYPRISLAPGQRFASKGAYIAQWPADERARLLPVSDWIAP
jgi:ABC-type branched-subunit amino acid transport system substrate-binding protein